MSYLSMLLLSTLCVLTKTHVGPRGMLASAVWLSVGMGVGSLWRVTSPVVPLLLIGHMDCVCQGAREQSISFMGLQETSKMNGVDSVAEREPLSIHKQNVLNWEERGKKSHCFTAPVDEDLILAAS